MIGSLKPGTGRVIRGHRVANLVYGIAVRLQHRSRRRLHDPADCHDHRKPALSRRGDSSRGTLLNNMPFTPKRVGDTNLIEHARAGVTMWYAIQNRDSL